MCMYVEGNVLKEGESKVLSLLGQYVRELRFRPDIQMLLCRLNSVSHNDSLVQLLLSCQSNSFWLENESVYLLFHTLQGVRKFPGPEV